jgi:DUF1009 family protein
VSGPFRSGGDFDDSPSSSSVFRIGRDATDRMIERAGALCRSGGWTLVKVARPEQDMRFDVPTIGPGTVRRLRLLGGACIVVEAGRTIIIDKPKTLALADELRIPILGRQAGGVDGAGR